MSDDEVDWRQYLADFHRDRAGIVEAVLSRDGERGDHTPVPVAWPGPSAAVPRPCWTWPAVRVRCPASCAEPGRTVIGLDTLGRRAPAGAERGPGPWVRADGLRLPFRDGSVDAVTSSIGLVVITPLESR